MNVKQYDLYISEERIPYLEAVKETTITDTDNINCPTKIADMMKEVFHADKLAEEHIWMICYDTRLHIIGFFDISHGTQDKSIIDPGAVMKRALMCGANQAALAHNHPSGDPTPSAEDIHFTAALKNAFGLFGIQLVDHVIIAGAERGGFYSFLEQKRL